MLFLWNQAPCRNDDFDERTGICVGHSQIPAELFGTLPHACQTDAQTAGSHLLNLPIDSPAIVTNLDHHLIFLLTQRNPSLIRLRMPEDVGQSLLYDAEDRSFQIGCEPWKISGLYLQRCHNTTPLRQPIEIPPNR